MDSCPVVIGQLALEVVFMRAPVIKLAVAILLLFGLAGCGGGESQNGASAPAAEPAPSAATVLEATSSAAESEPSPTATIAATQMPEAATTTVETATDATSAAESATAQPKVTSGAADGGAAATGSGRTFRIVPEQSETRYEVQEQFLDRDLPNKAVGKTNAIEGEFQFSTDGKPAGKVTTIKVDLRTLTSDSPRRDGRIRTQWLESDKYPYAEFTSTEAQNLPESYSEGQEVSFKLTGDMKIREVTKPVTFDVRGKLQGDTVTGTATAPIRMTDFGFDPPSIAGVLTVEDPVTLAIDFTAKEANSGQ